MVFTLRWLYSLQNENLVFLEFCDNLKKILSNVYPQNRYNFNKMNARNWENYGQPYDVKSIMQYSGYAFSFKKGFKRLVLLVVNFNKNL